jgi:signal transduction histidine kinase
MRRVGLPARVRVDPLLVDGLLAAALLVVGQLEMWVFGNLEGAKAVMVPVSVFTTASLALRRRAPVVPVLVLALGFGAVAIVLTALDDWPGEPQSVSMLATWVVSVYSVAAYGTLPAALFGAVVGAGMSGVDAALNPHVEWTPVASLFILIPWVAGRALRRQRLQAAELRELARQLEREREERARAAVAEERTRIARDLHDEVAHSVSVIAVQADAAEGALERDPELARQPLGAIKQTARGALAEMRRLLGVLRQPEDDVALAPQPGLGQVDALVEQARRAGLPIELTVEGERRELSPGLELSAYRIVQEALTNVLKHAGPARARVLLRYGGDALEIAVEDDGAGTGNGGGGGHGLVGARERAALYGGELEAGPLAGGGYALRARLPLAT